MSAAQHLQIKITKKLLKNYRRLRREIPILEYELKEMQTTDSGMGISTILNYQSGYPVPEGVRGFDWPLYERRKMVLESKKEKIQAVKDWIEAIEEGQTRCVFRMKYIDGMEWEKIAAKTGYAGNPNYPRLYIRDAYLKKCGIS